MPQIPSVPEPSSLLIQRANDVRDASITLGLSSNEQRKRALELMADSLTAKSNQIIEANQRDLETAESEGLNKSLLARLAFNEKKLANAIQGVRKVAELSDPIGDCQFQRELAPELILERVTVPLGVLGVIFEARPDAAIQIASLAIRSGNAAILKGGKEASYTNELIMKCLCEGLRISEVSQNALCLLTTREESLSLLRLDGLVDLIIPRGSNELVKFIQENTRIPVLGHADGICHLYIDSAADIDLGVRVAIDSKTQYPAACNAVETLLIHREIADEFLKVAIPAFDKSGVTLLGDKTSQSLGVQSNATEEDWSTEYLDLTLAVKVVENLDEALTHIRHYGSRHTDAIVTRNKVIAEKFLRTVDSAGVYLNCSTRFADGFRYGFGAEVGISTQTLPPRGPVGLEGLVTYRYLVRGEGHIAEEFASGKRKFTHKDLS